MKVSKLDKKDRTVRLLVGDTTPSFMNALRRISMNEVPVLAIEDLSIHENDSPLFDELLAQRLGQVPLKFDPGEFDLPEECDCEDGCPNCQAKFTLEMEGPGTLYSESLESESGNVEPLHGRIPITELGENHLVKLEATAVLSTGKEHSKHQAAVSSYQYYPRVSVDQDELSEDDVKKAVEVCPQDVFKEDDGKLKTVNEGDCTLCRECVKDVGDAIDVEGDDGKFVFKVESISGLEPQNILETATKILKEKAFEVIEKTT